MDEKEQSNFIQLDLIESGNKFSTLSLNGADIKLWMPESESFVARAKKDSFKRNERSFSIHFSSQLDFGKWRGNKVLFSFKMLGMLFFGEAKIESWAIDNSFELSISSGIYRYEKRKSDRLLAYPRYRFYCYFNFFEKDKVDNIAYISRPNQKVEETFNKYLSKRSFISDSGNPLTGLRILDISEDGVSFVANEKEMSFLNSDDIDLCLEVEGEKFNGVGSLIYSVHYIDPRISNVRMYKVGMTLTKMEQSYVQKIRSLLGDTVDLIKPEERFESFLK